MAGNSKRHSSKRPGPKVRVSQPGASRRWLFRLAALTLVPLLLLGMVEGALRLAGAGYPTSFFLVETREKQREILVENPKFSWRFFPRALARRPTPLLLTDPKPAETYRVFVFGESAAMGDPDPAFSFSRVLQVLLEERFPGTNFEVINLAFTAINSHVVLPQARESAKLRGDLWVIYMGNNEVVGPFGPATVFGQTTPSLRTIRATLALRKLRMAQIISNLAETRGARHSDWQGMRMFLENHIPLGDPRLEAVYGHFEKNLDGILEAGRRAGATIMVSTVASNLRDSAPFASVSNPALNDAQRKSFQESFERGEAREAEGEFETALAHYQKAARIDPGYAELHFRIGRLHLALENRQEAQASLELARDLDALRFRADSRLNAIIRKLGHQPESGIHLVEAEERFRQMAAESVPGDDLFFDHVHFTFEGNYLLARAAAEKAAQLLPRSIRSRDAGSWAQINHCADRLGLTPWNHAQMRENMLRRLSEPPFPQQTGHAARQQQHLAILRELRPALQPENLDAAIQVNQEALSAAPNDFYLRENLAKLFHARGKLPEAIQQIQQVIRLRPQNPAAYYNLGYFLSASGQHQEAIEAFQKALARRPDYPEACNALGELHLAQGESAKALQAFATALEFRALFPEALLNLARVLETQGKNEEARERLERALQIRPGFFPAHLRLGDMLARSGDFLRAAGHYADAIRSRPETILRFETAVEQHPQDPASHFFLANAQAARGDIDAAIQSLRKAIELEPRFWEARYFLGVELATRENLPEAMEQFKEVTKLRPDFSRAHLNLGVALARLEQFSEALPYFENASRLEPQNSALRQQLETVRYLAAGRKKPFGQVEQ
jgi:tetratricopeptide (TPR) repeat protein